MNTKPVCDSCVFARNNVTNFALQTLSPQQVSAICLTSGFYWLHGRRKNLFPERTSSIFFQGLDKKISYRGSAAVKFLFTNA